MFRYFMKRGWKFVLMGIGAATLFTLILMLLWNAVMPAVFGLHGISYWQALGLLILSKIFFGGCRGRHGPPPWAWRRRLIERWEQMTPEEREKFRHGMGHHWQHHGPPSGEPA